MTIINIIPTNPVCIFTFVMVLIRLSLVVLPRIINNVPEQFASMILSVARLCIIILDLHAGMFRFVADSFLELSNYLTNYSDRFRDLIFKTELNQHTRDVDSRYVPNCAIPPPSAPDRDEFTEGYDHLDEMAEFDADFDDEDLEPLF